MITVFAAAPLSNVSCLWNSRILGRGRVALDWIRDINRISRLGLRRVGLRRIGSHWIRLELGIPLQSKLYSVDIGTQIVLRKVKKMSYIYITILFSECGSTLGL